MHRHVLSKAFCGGGGKRYVSMDLALMRKGEYKYAQTTNVIGVHVCYWLILFMCEGLNWNNTTVFYRTGEKGMGSASKHKVNIRVEPPKNDNKQKLSYYIHIWKPPKSHPIDYCLNT